MQQALRLVHETALNQERLAALAKLDALIFLKPLTSADFFAELDGRKDLMILLAFVGDELAGYKIGYQHAPSTFYSWSGGVLPKFRGQRIATHLMQEQHQHAARLGYKLIRTQTRNRYRPMLLLNLKHGFDIIGTHLKSGENELIIVLEKSLSAVT